MDRMGWFRCGGSGIGVITLPWIDRWRVFFSSLGGGAGWKASGCRACALSYNSFVVSPNSGCRLRTFKTMSVVCLVPCLMKWVVAMLRSGTPSHDTMNPSNSQRAKFHAYSNHTLKAIQSHTRRSGLQLGLGDNLRGEHDAREMASHEPRRPFGLHNKFLAIQGY